MESRTVSSVVVLENEVKKAGREWKLPSWMGRLGMSMTYSASCAAWAAWAVRVDRSSSNVCWLVGSMANRFPGFDILLSVRCSGHEVRPDETAYFRR